MNFVVFKLLSFLFQLVEFLLVLFTDNSLLFKQSVLELRSFLDVLTTNNHL